jgi:NAD(P)H-hydrate epimerase
MKYMSVAEIRELDRWAIEELGIPQKQLMENAGRGVAKFVIREYPREKFRTVTIVCGKGNNGGDGLVVARLLRDKGYIIKTVKLPEENSLPPADLYVDAIFGTGLKDELAEPYIHIIEELNNSGKPIIAVDIPSGINGDHGPISSTYVKPVATITFVAAKLYMKTHPEYFGRIEVVDIGIPEPPFSTTGGDDSPLNSLP